MLADSKHHQMNIKEERKDVKVHSCLPLPPTLKPDPRGINAGRVSSVKSRPA